MDSVKKDDQDPECSDEEADPQMLASSSINTEMFPSRRGIQPRHGGNGHGNGNGSVTHKVELKRETLTMTAVQIARQKGYEAIPVRMQAIHHGAQWDVFKVRNLRCNQRMLLTTRLSLGRKERF